MADSTDPFTDQELKLIINTLDQAIKFDNEIIAGTVWFERPSISGKDILLSKMSPSGDERRILQITRMQLLRQKLQDKVVRYRKEQERNGE